MMRRVGLLLVLAALVSACDQLEALKQKLLGGGASAEQEPAELVEARDLLASGQTQTAIQRLEQFTSAHPSSAQGYYYLGLCLLSSAGDVSPSSSLSETEDKTRKAFERALTLNPRHARASIGLGDLYARHVPSRRRRPGGAGSPYQLALEAYEKAVSIDPKLPEARLHYARFLERVGRRKEAEQAYKAAADAAATIPEKAPDIYLAYGRFLVGQKGRWQDAIDQYELAQMFRQDDLEIQRELAVAHARMGQEYFDNEQYSLAEQTLSAAYELFPDKNDPEAVKAASTLDRLRNIRRR